MRYSFGERSLNANHWVGIDLADADLGATPLDAVVTVQAAGVVQHRRLGSVGKRQGHDDPVLVFGLGGHDGCVDVEVAFSDGTEVMFDVSLHPSFPYMQQMFQQTSAACCSEPGEDVIM